MSIERSASRPIKRGQAKLAKKHDKALIELLRKFFRFLDKRPKPSDEEVRSEFLKSEMTWKMYCMTHNLGIKTSLLFNARVSYEWERKYAQKNN